MHTLVVCVDRSGDVPAKTGLQTPIVGWEAVQSLVIDLGIADPEDAGVNSLLEGLRVTRDLRDGDEEATVAVVSGGGGEGVITADRAIAAQVDELVERVDPDAAIVVIEGVEDERVVPIIESRLQVDSVDRVVVRQARDLESTYYLMKQFLADEELRETVLVPLGVVLLVFPALLTLTDSLALAIASITAVIGVFLLYKGLSIDDYLAEVPADLQEALYSGRVSIVTYVIAAGLALVGLFAGVLSTQEFGSTPPPLLGAMAFTYHAIPWLALGALAASAGRLLDEIIRGGRLRTSFLNLPFAVLAVGLVVRGFSGYFLERADALGPVFLPALEVGIIAIEGLALTPEERLGVFVVGGVVVSLVGIRVSTALSGTEFEEPEETT